MHGHSAPVFNIGETYIGYTSTKFMVECYKGSTAYCATLCSTKSVDCAQQIAGLAINYPMRRPCAALDLKLHIPMKNNSVATKACNMCSYPLYV